MVSMPSFLRPPHWPFLACAVVIIGLWLAWIGVMTVNHPAVSSPDEAGNALMARQFAQTNHLSYPTSLTPTELSHFYPRSLTVKGNQLLPGSFVGFVLLEGSLLKLGSATPIIFELLVFAAALIGWYRVGRRYWEWPWALGATFLMASIPVILQHLTIPFVQPALYISFLLLTGFFLLRFQEQQTWMRAIIVGVCYGLALFIRPVEVIFTGPMIAILMLVHRGKRTRLLATTAVTILIQLPWLLAARSVFGSPLASGYTTDGVSLTGGGGGLPWWSIFTTPPGGVWSWHWLRNVWDYLILLYPAMSLMSVAALLAYFHRKFISWVKVLKIGAMALFGMYFLAYYGSWDLYPGTLASRIGSAASYARYWIVLYAAMSAGVIVFLRLTTKKRLAVAIPVILAVVGMNVWTWWAHPSGYRRFTHRSDQVQAFTSQVRQLTPERSLILAGQDEKYFVGQRESSYRYPTTAEDWAVLRGVVAGRPVFALGAGMAMTPDVFLASIHDHGLDATSVATIDGSPMWQLTEAQP